MSDLNDDLLQQLEDGAAAMGLETTEDGGVIEMHQGEEMGDQELVEEVITEEGTHLGHEDQDIIVETDTSGVDSVHDLITLHGVEDQADLMDSAAQMGIQMDQASMDQMMDTSNIVEEVITSTQAQEDSLMEQSMQQQFVDDQVFNPETGTLQPLSSLNAQKPAEPEPSKPAPVKKPVTKQVKYIIAQPQGEGGSQGGPILLDASQLQGLMNAGVVKAGQNIILPAAKKAIRSPAKILPAPIPVGDQQQPSNSPKFIMKSGSILAPLTGGIPGGKVLQIGSGSQVRYVQLVPRKSVPTNKIPIAPAKPKVVAPRPAGQTIILPAGDLNQSLSNFVVMPGGIMLKQETSTTAIPIRQNTSISDQLEASILTSVNQTQSSGQYDSFRSLLEPNGMRPRKPCNCTKSQCLKLYCDCFANGEFCNLCNCTNCFNNLQHEEDRQKAIKLVLERNPGAFRPKIGKSSSTGEAHERRHNKGCNCRRSGCLKNYCECYEAKIFCSGICKCTGCKNCIENIPTGLPNGVGVEQHFAGAGTSHRQTLKDLAEAAEVRVQQQTQVKNKMRAQMQEVIPQNNLGVMVPPLVFRYPQGSISYEVVTSTVELLLARAEAAERAKLPEGEVERAILEEFGDCLASVMELGSTIVDNNP